MMRASPIILLVVLYLPLLTAGADPVNQLATMNVLDNMHKIRPGDSLSIKIMSGKRHEFDVIVSVNGDLQVPGFVRIKATGVTPMVLAFQMKSKLERAGFSALR